MFSLPWLVVLAIILIYTHLLVSMVTVYFHRMASHKAITLKPWLLRAFRFFAWFGMGMDPTEFAAVHRKHHATVDTMDDPHSPVKYGWAGVLYKGVFLYRQAAKDPQVMEKYGKGVPVDSLDGFYHRNEFLGILSQGILWMALLGWQGMLIWVVAMLWIPFWAAGVVNGLGHHFGYRRFPTDDLSTNLIPWGILLGGEELHNNHHADPGSAKFSSAWYEIDAGWGYIKLMQRLHWLTIRRGESEGRAPGASAVAGLPTVAMVTRERYVWLRNLYKAYDQVAKGELHQYGYRKWKQLTRFTVNGQVDTRKVRALGSPVIAKLLEQEQKLKAVLARRSYALRGGVEPAKAAFEQWVAEMERLGIRLAPHKFVVVKP